MEPDHPTLLLTRPEAQSRRFAETFRARFGARWPVVIAPLTEIVWLAPPLPTPLPDHVLFTSENAVMAFTRLSADRSATAWCVGPRTRAVAEAAGFLTRVGPDDAKGLARTVAAEGNVRRVLYPRPVHAAGDLAGELRSAGTETISLVVYDQREQPLPDAAKALLSAPAPVLVPLFSPRSARLAAKALRDAVAPLCVAALSPAVAEVARALTPAHLVTASRPDGDAMLDALDALLAAGKTG